MTQVTTMQTMVDAVVYVVLHDVLRQTIRKCLRWDQQCMGEGSASRLRLLRGVEDQTCRREACNQRDDDQDTIADQQNNKHQRPYVTTTVPGGPVEPNIA